MKAKLCKCNNCDTVMIDQNPKTETPEFNVPDNATDMQFIDDASGGFWACPVCEDDRYLMDITEENQLSAPSTPVEDKQTEDINCWDCGKPTIGGICNCDKPTESNKQPLYKVLNEKRTQGHIITIASGLDANYLITGSDKIGEVYCGSEYEIEEAEANAQYTALAVNNFAALAEALENSIAWNKAIMKLIDDGRLDVEKMRDNFHLVQNDMEQALNRIS